jgi:predicted Zn-dependent peptidase
MSSRLFEEVREKRGLAYEIRSGMHFFHDTGAFTISAGVEEEKTPLTIRVILRELAKVCAKPVGFSELRRAKDYFLSQLNMALEDTLEHLLWVGEYVLDRRQLPDCEKIRRSVNAVTEKDVQGIARRIFRTVNLNLALIGSMSDKVQAQIRKDFEMPIAVGN